MFRVGVYIPKDIFEDSGLWVQLPQTLKPSAPERP